MTAQTDAQRAASYRQRRAAKLQRLAAYEAALKRIVAHDHELSNSDLPRLGKDTGWELAMRLCGDIARQALAADRFELENGA